MPSSSPSAFIAVDAGTTRTRAWLVDGEHVVARHEVLAGARDAARGATGVLAGAVRDVVARLRDEAGDLRPSCIAAAGMITSREGLFEVPHVAAPAGAAEIAAAICRTRLPDVSDLPFVLVPGVRTTAMGGAHGVGAGDIMRGEETLCLGLLRTGGLAPGGTLLNVGSHWKLVHVDDRGRVAWSHTSLGGEMAHALSRETILASAVPAGPLATIDPVRLREGMAEARRAGVPRALFCVRLLQLADETGPEGRMSFLLGALVGADMDGLHAQGLLEPGTAIAVSGDEKVAGAWSLALRERGHGVRTLAPADVDAAFVAGLRAVLEVVPIRE